MTQNAPTYASPDCLQRLPGAGRQELGLSLFPSTTTVFQVFLKFLMIDLGILYNAWTPGYVPLSPSLHKVRHGYLHTYFMVFFASKNTFSQFH